jgi:hypothetical protein
MAGKPVGEVQQKARKESGLGSAQQEADPSTRSAAFKA